ncbi:hypothetical protein [Azotobacter beijerinckii]|uniref:Uncharacterized protein n=1 Tax=Azotobacter beijerinckii TaxID=170623 RepID=A0A1I0Z2Y7_9GAMM|nr:hypothetical protein [Azotobacter beijerinckii]SFB19742.1 hypothetical protein SAMN04244571_01751 [Azotobacter beijerinckii]
MTDQELSKTVQVNREIVESTLSQVLIEELPRVGLHDKTAFAKETAKAVLAAYVELALFISSEPQD